MPDSQSSSDNTSESLSINELAYCLGLSLSIKKEENTRRGMCLEAPLVLRALTLGTDEVKN